MESSEVNGTSTEDQVSDGEKDTSTGSPFENPVFKQLSRINGEINRMSKEDIVSQLAALRLDTRGNKEVVKKRLKNFYKKQKLVKAKVKDPLEGSKYFDYLVVIDFEATCEVVNPKDYAFEIIEFPAILVNASKKNIEDEFHSYCQPVVNPKLSSFCTSLTGITQEQVDAAPVFHEVLKNFHQWLEKHGLGSKYKFAVVTDGPWDMGRFLMCQCDLSAIEFPKFGKKWINIRKTYSNFYECRKGNLEKMLEILGLQFEGRLHCGLDDARNIARILIRMMKDGANVCVNERLQSYRYSASQNTAMPNNVINVSRKEFLEDSKICQNRNWSDRHNCLCQGNGGGINDSCRLTEEKTNASSLEDCALGIREAGAVANGDKTVCDVCSGKKSHRNKKDTKKSNQSQLEMDTFSNLGVDPSLEGTEFRLIQQKQKAKKI